ncbi:Chaperone J-domain-containing protein [Glarea lozoyensis ATCC 20868]|uniref:Chaperone J-domain-containing protein n=1 Tax=Glarea lozoyensis (strain ATCC 20868 / MF5171) TaxID=1116229 RepID=S3DAY0_GLAL2|nr:Chaperone J-domain-containing protein [Glarea lozoyensis ATCC 20868]EPE34259.1 Chaperone J-domain-containing protein [Glarea lozoyensis ATCC 20868]
MDPFDRPELTISDYHADLGLPQQASFRDVKLALFRLARKHHPDKKAPGMFIDAQDFRKSPIDLASLTQVREAYKCLSDKAKRVAYDAFYFDLQDQWTCYRELKETQCKDEERKRADQEQRAVRERSERERKAAEHREGEPEPPSRSSTGAHPRFGWPRKKGRANCVFCRDSHLKWSFRCPECNVSACASFILHNVDPDGISLPKLKTATK